jgi:hypothetical protein
VSYIPTYPILTKLGLEPAEPASHADWWENEAATLAVLRRSDGTTVIYNRKSVKVPLVVVWDGPLESEQHLYNVLIDNAISIGTHVRPTRNK